MQRATVEELEIYLTPLGLWRKRAAALKSLAKVVTASGGKLPNTKEELEKLPGIGVYTANAVMTVVHGIAEPLADINMARVLGRFFLGENDKRYRRRVGFYVLAGQIVSGEKSLQVNWAVLDFGARVCKAIRPLCEQCPLKERCVYLNQ